jgi:hypothetical protein
MSTLDQRLSNIRRFDRYKDFEMDMIDDCHVRFMKLFPFCHEDPPPVESDYKRFHLRFYIPRDIFQDKSATVNKVFIFLNGLDELYDFTLYDQLGQGLAKNGYASILLPLPNHLNRNRMFRFNDETKKEVPSDTFIAEREKIYDAYLQLLGEIQILVDHLRHRCGRIEEDHNCAFYRHLFDKDLRISILGYSIGGLGALSNFLLNKTFSSCVLLNAGAKLEDIDISSFSKRLDDWKSMVDGLHIDWRKPLDNSERASIFERIFLGKDLYLLKKDLKEVSRKTLFILAGADDVNRYKSIMEIEPEEHGLSILKLPGIHHFPSIDTEWNKWFKIVINMIAQFDESAYKDTLSYNEIFKDLINYQIKYKIFDGCNKYCIERITDPDDKFKFYRLIYVAESIFGSMNTAIIEMYLFIDKMISRPKLLPIMKRVPGQKLFGFVAKNKFNLSEKVIRKTLKLQKEASQQTLGKEIPRFGDLLIKSNHLSESQVNEVLRIQKQI